MTSRLPVLAALSFAACVHSSPPVVEPVVAAPVVQPLQRVAYAGDIQLEAHLENPGDTVPLPLGWAQTCTEGGVCLVEQTVGTGAGAQTERIWSTPTATWSEGAATSYPGFEAEAHRRLLTLFGAQEDTELRYAHPRLGTVVDAARCGPTGQQGVPMSLQVTHHGADIAWQGTMVLDSVAETTPLEVPAAPPPVQFDAPSIERIRDGLWDVKVPQYDARSFIVEFDTFVVVFEAPWSSAVGEGIVDAIEEKLPDKPIRYVLYSHHHPHYTGGLRAFIAAGATVVAPQLHEDFVRSIAARSFELEPDRLAESGAGMKLQTFEGHFEIEEGSRRLEVLDIGARSQHTAAYMLLWMPSERVLIEGDIGWFVGPDGGLNVGQRSVGLLEAVDARSLDVETLLQSWPVVSQQPTLAMKDFRAAVEAAR